MAETFVQKEGITVNHETQLLSQQEKDVLGEIANISFGSASTILSTLLNKTVTITAPHVEVVSLYDTSDIAIPHVVLNIHFTKGLEMDNLLVINQEVALAIADLMMMGTGEIDHNKELTELELSAVQEAMNQMMGFAATSMSEFFQETVDMTPPTIKVVKLKEEIAKIVDTEDHTKIVKVSFDLTIENLVNSKLVQIVPLQNAKKMVQELMRLSGETEELQPSGEAEFKHEIITQEQRDMLGEIANISIGSASTVLSTVLNQPVHISVPAVDVISARKYDEMSLPHVVLNVDFIHGVKYENVFVLTKEIVLSMVDMMMMGAGEIDLQQELGEFELSAAKEIMNQMMGHAATSMSELFGGIVDISPPSIKIVTIKEELQQLASTRSTEEMVQITFDLEIGDAVHSKMYQFLSVSEAIAMTEQLSALIGTEEHVQETQPVVLPEWGNARTEEQPLLASEEITKKSRLLQNIEVSLEFVFGSTTRTIEDILQLNENEVVVLEESVDEPIQVFANGVLIAYGELVSVDGFFGVKVKKTL